MERKRETEEEGESEEENRSSIMTIGHYGSPDLATSDCRRMAEDRKTFRRSKYYNLTYQILRLTASALPTETLEDVDFRSEDKGNQDLSIFHMFA